MHLVTTILLLLFVTALSNLAVGVVRVPLPLLQVAIGALAAYAGLRVDFDPDVFLLLFIPPLLFADAYRIPKRELMEERGPVLALSVGLVLFTVVGLGHVVHWVLPVVPLAAAFALAAALSPTDAVAVSGVLAGRPAPRRFMHILEGEALLNDASGLVSFSFAVTAVVTGTFSLGYATASFVVIAAGGLAVGAALGYGFALLDRYVLTRRIDEAAIYVTFVMLLPFVAYLISEEIGVSGILAAVSAGLTSNAMNPFGGGKSHTRLGTAAIWGVVEYAFNGVIFLLLGLQLPEIFRDGIRLTRSAGYSPWALLALTLVVTVTLFALRLVWVVVSIGVRRQVHYLRRKEWVNPGLPEMLGLVVAGVRGAVTLAGILSLPLVTANGHNFPARAVLIAVAAGVILFSLVIAAVGLPLLLPFMRMPETDPIVEQAAQARREMADAAVQEMQRLRPQAVARRTGDALLAYENASDMVLADYGRRLQSHDDHDVAHDGALAEQRAEMAIRLRAVRAERVELRRLRTARRLNDETVRLLLEELDFEEQSLTRMGEALRRSG
jgi:CPA1 family monovalent cation:H+ antiporter